MKKYVSCFLFFFCLTAGCLIGLFCITRNMEQEETRQVQAVETLEEPAFAMETASEPMLHLVLNQEQVTAKEHVNMYCLVAEAGYLIVYDKTDKTVNLFTHMPLGEFPETEQEKLLEGIWFPTMTELFSYLESYSS